MGCRATAKGENFRGRLDKLESLDNGLICSKEASHPL